MPARSSSLYFYPKDNTPGCTTEAMQFRDHHKEFVKNGAVVFGVSARQHGVARQVQGQALELPFELIADTEEKLCHMFGVVKNKIMYGKKVKGIERSTFLIDGAGVLKPEWRGLKVAGHVEEVLKEVKALEEGGLSSARLPCPEKSQPQSSRLFSYAGKSSNELCIMVRMPDSLELRTPTEPHELTVPAFLFPRQPPEPPRLPCPCPSRLQNEPPSLSRRRLRYPGRERLNPANVRNAKTRSSAAEFRPPAVMELQDTVAGARRGLPAKPSQRPRPHRHRGAIAAGRAQRALPRPEPAEPRGVQTVRRRSSGSTPTC